MLKKVFSFVLFVAFAFILSTPLRTQAAPSAWSFRSASETIETNGATTMTYYQYKNFDLLKNDAVIFETSDNFDDYTVRWQSSNSDAVWINQYTGQTRVNKFDTFDEDFATVKISAVIKNTKTGKQIVRSFFVEVDNREFTQKTEAPTLTPEVTVTPSPTPEATVTPSPTPEAETPESTESEPVSQKKNGIKKLTLGRTWKTDVAVLTDTFDFFCEGKTLKPEQIFGIESYDCVEVGDPVSKTYIRTISLKVQVQAMNPNWEDPNHYIIAKVDINHYFDVVD